MNRAAFVAFVVVTLLALLGMCWPLIQRAVG